MRNIECHSTLTDGERDLFNGDDETCPSHSTVTSNIVVFRHPLPPTSSVMTSDNAATTRSSVGRYANYLRSSSSKIVKDLRCALWTKSKSSLSHKSTILLRTKRQIHLHTYGGREGTCAIKKSCNSCSRLISRELYVVGTTIKYKSKSIIPQHINTLIFC